jgi:hypothetical protein
MLHMRTLGRLMTGRKSPAAGGGEASRLYAPKGVQTRTNGALILRQSDSNAARLSGRPAKGGRSSLRFDTLLSI